MTCGLFTEYTKTSRLRLCRARIDVTGTIGPSVCSSTCALEVEILTPGAAANTGTAGVICAERIRHPDRLTCPLLRTGPEGSGQFREMGWDEALDRVAGAFAETASRRKNTISVATAESGRNPACPIQRISRSDGIIRSGVMRGKTTR